MNTLSKFTLSIFGDYHEFSASTDRAIEFMKKLQDEEFDGFLPTTIIGKNIDVDKGTIINDNRMVFNSINKDLLITIEIPAERININVQLENIEQLDQAIITESFSKCEKIMVIVMNHFKIKSFRLALNINIIGDKLSVREVAEYAKSQIKVDPFYTDKDISEFNLHYNAKRIIKMNDDEKLNVIRNIQTIENQSDLRVLSVIDINTDQKDLRYRFTSSSVKSFVKQTRNMVFDLCGVNNEKTKK